MSEQRRDGDAAHSLDRLESVVKQRTDGAVWRAFCVAQAQVRERRREKTTQRIFLLGRS